MGGRNGNVVGAELKERGIHFEGLRRRRLQRLCKKSGIPANRSSAFLVEALNKLLQNGSTVPPLFPGPGSCKTKTPHNPLVRQPAATASVKRKAEVGLERVIAHKDSRHIDKKFRGKDENGECEGRLLCNGELLHPRDTMHNCQGTKEANACEMQKIKKEQAEFGPTDAQGRGLLDDTCNDDDDPFDDRFARLDGFTKSMEAVSALEDDDTDVNQDTGVQAGAREVDACGKKACSPREPDVYTPFLDKVVIVKENTIDGEVAAVGGMPALTAVEQGTRKESCVPDNGNTRTTHFIDTEKGRHLKQMPGEYSCEPVVLVFGTPSEQSNLSGSGWVDPPGKLASISYLSGPDGLKRRWSVVEESSQVCLEPPRPVSNSSMVAASQNFEFHVHRPEGISLTVDLNDDKRSPGPAGLQYLEAVSPGSNRSVATMPMAVRVTRISSIRDLAPGLASKCPCRRGLVPSLAGGVLK